MSRTSHATASDKLRMFRDAADVFWPRYGAWAYDTWARLNAECFGGRLAPIPILWGLTPHGGTLGYCSVHAITLHPSLVNPRTANPWYCGSKLGERYAADVLLHEMVHQANHQDGGGRGDGSSSHNCEAWVREVNRISPLIGVDARAQVLRQRRVDGRVVRSPEPGYLTQRQLGSWPHCVRPSGYYASPVIACDAEVTP
jgi:hypothetical protein